MAGKNTAIGPHPHASRTGEQVVCTRSDDEIRKRLQPPLGRELTDAELVRVRECVGMGEAVVRVQGELARAEDIARTLARISKSHPDDALAALRACDESTRGLLESASLRRFSTTLDGRHTLTVKPGEPFAPGVAPRRRASSLAADALAQFEPARGRPGRNEVAKMLAGIALPLWRVLAPGKSDRAWVAHEFSSPCYRFLYEFFYLSGMGSTSERIIVAASRAARGHFGGLA